MAYFRIIAMLLFLEFLDQRYGRKMKKKGKDISQLPARMNPVSHSMRDAKAYALHVLEEGTSYLWAVLMITAKSKWIWQIKYIENYRTQTIQIYKINPVLQLILLLKLSHPHKGKEYIQQILWSLLACATGWFKPPTNTPTSMKSFGLTWQKCAIYTVISPPFFLTRPHQLLQC